jgi:hypothetical protein
MQVAKVQQIETSVSEYDAVAGSTPLDYGIWE